MVKMVKEPMASETPPARDHESQASRFFLGDFVQKIRLLSLLHGHAKAPRGLINACATLLDVVKTAWCLFWEQELWDEIWELAENNIHGDGLKEQERT